MSVLYNFPKQAAVGRILAKSKIYEHASPSSKVKELFVREVEKITWAYKLAQNTINLSASRAVKEIQIFEIALKTKNISQEVLQAIDTAIPSPIIFVISFKSKIRYLAAYKRPSEADKKKSVLSTYFETDWMSDNAELAKLPVVLNLEALYQKILKSIIKLPERRGESIDSLVLRAELLQARSSEIAKLESRMRREKQFNKKVELNSKLRKLSQELEELRA